MRLLHETSEADMIAVFLRAELASLRFKAQITEQLERDHAELRVVEAPDITSVAENAYRRQLLASYRAYLFDELPAQIAWYRALLDGDEVARVRYIDYSYWNELSDHTRLPTVAADTVRAGREIFGVSNQNFLNAARALRDGARFPELIVVGAAPDAALTVIEGHLRLTAYLLAPECIPEHVEVIAGFAPECAAI